MADDDLTDQLEMLSRAIALGLLEVHGRWVEAHLKAIRLRPDGSIDPNTVSSEVKQIAASLAAAKAKDDQKISLRNVQEHYFEVLHKYFGRQYAEMVKFGSTPEHSARLFASIPMAVSVIERALQDLRPEIEAFWKGYGSVVDARLRTNPGAKAVYGGAGAPAHEANCLSRTGLYVDTTILPDPLYNAALFWDVATPTARIYQLLKESLSLLSLESVILAEVDPPIAVVAPDFFETGTRVTDSLFDLAASDGTFHLGKCFDAVLSTQDVTNSFVAGIRTIEDLKMKLKDPRRFLLDIQRSESIDRTWKRFEKDLTLAIQNPGTDETIGQQLLNHSSAMMLEVNQIIYKAKRYGASAVMESPTTWQYLLWKYEYDAERACLESPDASPEFIVNALQDPALAWLGNVPHQELIRLRKEGALSELRALFSNGIGAIDSANHDSFREVVAGVVQNIENAVSTHSAEIRRLSRDGKKFFGISVGGWLVTGSISIAAAVTGNVPLAVASTLLGMVGLPSGREVVREGQDLITARKHVKRSPVAVLFNAKTEKG